MEKLLIVGELANDEDLACFFEREGYEVSGALSSYGALEEVRRGDVALLIVSQHLGDRGGVKLLKAVRATDPRCEVILISSGVAEVELPTNEASRRVAAQALRAGALDYLRRPIGLRHLRVALGHARHARAAASPPEFLAAE